MKKQLSPLTGAFLLVLLFFSVQTFCQDFALLDNSERKIKIPYRTEAAFSMNGVWSVFNDANKLQAVEIYKKNDLVEFKTGDDADAFMKEMIAEKIQLQADIDMVNMQTLYDDYDYVSDKKIILDNYKVVVMELQNQAKEVNCFEEAEQIAAEIKKLYENVYYLVYQNTQELEKQLKNCKDFNAIKALLLK